MFIFELAKKIFKPEKKETEFEYNPLNLEKPTDEYEGEEMQIWKVDCKVIHGFFMVLRVST